MKKHFLFVLFIVVLLSGCNATHLDLLPELEDPSLMDKKLSVKQLHQDMDALVKGALERHPELSAYSNLTALNSALAAYKTEITAPMTRTEFYKVVGKLSHHFGDGHSFLIWPYQEFNALKEQGHKPFPFDVAITKNGEIVLKSSYKNENKHITAGAKIKQINGINANELLQTMQQYSGGETQYLREQIVARRFPVALWAVFGLIDEFELVLTEGSVDKVVTLNAEQQWQASQLEKNDNDFYYKKLQEGVGYLYLAHFDIGPSEFEEFIDQQFAQIQADNVNSLIIDIRNNPGGNTDTVTYLTRYLAHKSFRLVSSVREKLNQQNRGWFNYKGEVGEVINEEWTDWESPINNENKFEGDTYLVVGAISYSAAIVLATTLKDNKFAILVGETTGGFANQTAQGNLFNLPNSHLRAYVATKVLVRPSGDISRHGVVPHYVATNSVDDIKEQRDVGLEQVLKLIASK